MRITTKGRYALRALLALAKMGKDGKMISIQALSEAEDISSMFLEQIFFRLKKAGILKSARGPGGGFSFNRPLSSLSVFEVLKASGEEIAVLPCDRKTSDCNRFGKCIAHQVIVSVNEVTNKYLDSITLKMVLEDKEFQPAPLKTKR